MKTRIIQTRFWLDNFIAKLKPEYKLLFLYLISNERIELTGAYEIPISYIAMETGLSPKQVNDGLQILSPKILYVDGYVIVLNAKKYQDYSKGSERQRGAFDREYDKLPESIKSILDNTSELVKNQLGTSSELDINNKVEIRNKKVEIRKDQDEKKITTISLFEENQEDILKLAIEKYPNKDCKKALEDYLGYITTRNTKYKDFKLAFFNWVREDRFNKYSISGIKANGAVRAEPGKYDNIKKTIIEN